MQTFLPYPDFQQSAKCLDYRRLCKQRAEARQILSTLLVGGGWKHHPAVRMWRGYENALIVYGNVMIQEWIDRGYHNGMPILPLDTNAYPLVNPWWCGDYRFHRAHRSNLLRKNCEYYQQFGWQEPPNLPYWWPTNGGKRG